MLTTKRLYPFIIAAFLSASLVACSSGGKDKTTQAPQPSPSVAVTPTPTPSRSITQAAIPDNSSLSPKFRAKWMQNHEKKDHDGLVAYVKGCLSDYWAADVKLTGEPVPMVLNVRRHTVSYQNGQRVVAKEASGNTTHLNLDHANDVHSDLDGDTSRCVDEFFAKANETGKVPVWPKPKRHRESPKP